MKICINCDQEANFKYMNLKPMCKDHFLEVALALKQITGADILKKSANVANSSKIKWDN